MMLFAASSPKIGATISVSSSGKEERRHEVTRERCIITIGGNETKRPANAFILSDFVRRAGGPDARIVIIPSASEVPERRVAQYTRVFRSLGARNIVAVHAERGSVTAEELGSIRTATGVFVVGGDQRVLMAALRSTGCVDAIREAVEHGAVYAGTSAGASAATQTMIARSVTEQGPDVCEFDEGLGLVSHVIIDQHFSERGRLPRLLFASTENNLPGVGIDEDTAVVWTGEGSLEVTGSGRVTIVAPENGTGSGRAYRLRILDPGTKYELPPEESLEETEAVA